MALYAIGDLQGCLEPLKMLLEHVNFDTTQDRLWLTGDLVNRGPDSAGTLRFVRELGDCVDIVLGNHDLHLLAIHSGIKETTNSDILTTLTSPTIEADLAWLATQPLLQYDSERRLIMTHAGIPPCWTDEQAISLATEAQKILSDAKTRCAFFEQMYGNAPDTWHNNLNGHDRMRYIVNAFTRMRFCAADGRLDFSHSGSADCAPENMKPWFTWPIRRNHTLIFGHWAALMGVTHSDDYIGLDTGYVWGNYLTIMNLDSGEKNHCDSNGLVFYQV